MSSPFETHCMYSSRTEGAPLIQDAVYTREAQKGSIFKHKMTGLLIHLEAPHAPHAPQTPLCVIKTMPIARRQFVQTIVVWTDMQYLKLDKYMFKH